MFRVLLVTVIVPPAHTGSTEMGLNWHTNFGFSLNDLCEFTAVQVMDSYFL